jgi:ABC-type multidrug transport system fused ATPase/permease subunit
MSRLTVEITEEDALDFLIRHYDETEKQQTKRNRSRFFLSLLFLLIGFYYLFTNAQTTAIIFLVLALLWYFIVPYYFRSAVKHTYREHVKKNMGMILNKPFTYELKEKGVFVKYELEEATYLYENIDGISRAGRNVYINHNGKFPLIIPYSDKSAEIDRFIEALERRLEKYRSSD